MGEVVTQKARKAEVTAGFKEGGLKEGRSEFQVSRFYVNPTQKWGTTAPNYMRWAVGGAYNHT